MKLADMIYKRRSVRKYEEILLKEADIKSINDFIKDITPLYPDIKVRIELVGKEKIRTVMPWITDKVITVFSEPKEGYLLNVGFMLQQLDLFLQAHGMGSCWIGLAKNRGDSISEDGLKYVIMLSVGYPKDPMRNDVSQFSRKELAEISDTSDIRLEPARFAPSSTNSQPWFFVHDRQDIHVFYTKPGLLSISKARSEMHIIDIGIALSHMYVSNTDTFAFFKAEPTPQYNGYDYIGSFKI